MHPLAALTARLFRPQPSTAHRRLRLALLPLEDRTTPAVFNVANGDVGGLITAINASNTNNQSDTINLAAGGVYTFGAAADATAGGSALPSILTDSALATNTLTINGNGATLARSTAAGTPFFRFLRVANAAGTSVSPTVTVNGVDFTGGLLDPAASGVSARGGAVFLAGGSLTIADSSFTGNQAPNGGAADCNQLASGRVFNLTRDTFTQNAANRGGAVNNNSNAPLTVTGCTFVGNTASDDGGAIHVNTINHTTTIIGSTFVNNTASSAGGGAVNSQGTLTVDTSTFSGNVTGGNGGGVWVQGDLIVTNSTFSGNNATSSVGGGGGIWVQGDLIVQNGTVVGNRAGSGGGITYALGGNSASILFSTITGNTAYFGLASGGGLQIGGQNLTLRDSVVAGNAFEANVANGTGPDVSGTVSSSGYNFIGDGSGATFSGAPAGNQVGTTAAPLDPKLGPLANHGGPTPTMLPLSGSPLLDAGDPVFVAPPAGDQRGRPRVSFGRADIGASESDQVQATAILVNGGAAQRSMVTSITVRFNSLVTFAGSSVGAFQLTRTGPGGPTGAVTIAVDLSGSTATRTVAHLTFGGALAASGSLTDGTYALTVLSSQVSAGGRALDGDGDGVAGGDSVASLFRFFGDITGDRFVNGADFALFRAAFGTSTGDSNYNAAFDVNGDGFVNGADFAVFRTNFGGSI